MHADLIARHAALRQLFNAHDCTTSSLGTRHWPCSSKPQWLFEYAVAQRLATTFVCQCAFCLEVVGMLYASSIALCVINVCNTTICAEATASAACVLGADGQLAATHQLPITHLPAVADAAHYQQHTVPLSLDMSTVTSGGCSEQDTPMGSALQPSQQQPQTELDKQPPRLSCCTLSTPNTSHSALSDDHAVYSTGKNTRAGNRVWLSSQMNVGSSQAVLPVRLKEFLPQTWAKGRT